MIRDRTRQEGKVITKFRFVRELGWVSPMHVKIILTRYSVIEPKR